MPPPGELRVEVARRDRESASIVLIGDLEYGSITPLNKAGDTLLGEGRVRLVVDVSEVGFCDSSGMSALVTLWNAARRHGGRMSLAGLHGQLAARLTRVGLVDLFGQESEPTPAE